MHKSRNIYRGKNVCQWVRQHLFIIPSMATRGCWLPGGVQGQVLMSGKIVGPPLRHLVVSYESFYKCYGRRPEGLKALSKMTNNSRFSSQMSPNSWFLILRNWLSSNPKWFPIPYQGLGSPQITMQQDKNLQRWDNDFRGVMGRRIRGEDGELEGG